MTPHNDDILARVPRLSMEDALRFPAMSRPVPAPEQQGDVSRGPDGHEHVFIHTGRCQFCDEPSPFLPREEQQGEPVCARCGHPEFALDGSAVHISECDPDGGDDSDDWCLWCANEKRQIWGHAYAIPPAPPSSGEAEARRWLRAEESPDFVVWRVNNKDGLPVAAQTISKELEAAIRSPLEERVRDLIKDRDSWVNYSMALFERARTTEKERDEAQAAAAHYSLLDSNSRNRAEAQVDRLREDYLNLHREQTALWAQVAELRERLRRIRTMAAPAGADYGDAAIVREVDDALAETVQEGGETQ